MWLGDPDNSPLTTPGPIGSAARDMGLRAADLAAHTERGAEVALGLLDEEERRLRARYVVVTSCVDTPTDSGRSLHAIGLAQTLRRCGERACATIRHAAAPGPADREVRAVTAGEQFVHELFDRESADRGGYRNAVTASELMAILALARNVPDLRRRVGALVLGFAENGTPTTVASVDRSRRLAQELRGALRPAFFATASGTPVFVHTASSEHLAHGGSSVVADELALRCADYVVTEAEPGAEKFFDLKCRSARISPNAAILVVSVRDVRALGARARPPRNTLEEGARALAAQIENVRLFGVPVIAAVHGQATDEAAELALVRDAALTGGATAAHVTGMHDDGELVGQPLAAAVIAASEPPSCFRLLYPSRASLDEKLATIARQVYRLDGVEYEDSALDSLGHFEPSDWDQLPACVAGTPGPAGILSGGARRVGGHLLVRQVELMTGAGFVRVIAEPRE